MNLRRDITVAFTGHRSYAGEADEELHRVVEHLYDQGFRRFLCGMAWGWDLTAGRVVMQLKKVHPDVELVAVVPYRGFGNLFHGTDEELYKSVAGAADSIEIVCENGSDMSYMLRNNFLVDNASVVVAWWNGKPRSGTAYTVGRARKSRVEVVNLYPQSQLEFGF